MTVYIYVWYGNAVPQSIAATGNKPSEDREYQWFISRNSRKYFPQSGLKMQWRQQVMRFLALGYEPGGREFDPRPAKPETDAEGEAARLPVNLSGRAK